MGVIAGKAGAIGMFEKTPATAVPPSRRLFVDLSVAVEDADDGEALDVPTVRCHLVLDRRIDPPGLGGEGWSQLSTGDAAGQDGAEPNDSTDGEVPDEGALVNAPDELAGGGAGDGASSG